MADHEVGNQLQMRASDIDLFMEKTQHRKTLLLLEKSTKTFDEKIAFRDERRKIEPLNNDSSYYVNGWDNYQAVQRTQQILANFSDAEVAPKGLVVEIYQSESDDWSYFKANFFARQLSLVDTIEEKKSNYECVVVLAGTAHLFDPQMKTIFEDDFVFFFNDHYSSERKFIEEYRYVFKNLYHYSLQ